MTDAPVVEEVTTEAPADSTETVEVDYKAESEKWKKFARENEKRAKENADKATKFDKLEESKKTESEKLQARIAELEGELSKTQRTALVSRLQAKHGFEDDDLDFLTGTDEETLTAQAEKLAARLGKVAEDAGKPRAPKADTTQGASQKKPYALNDFDALTKALLGKVGA